MIRTILIICLCFTSGAYAQKVPLHVAIATFEPPFVIQGTHKEIYGFDADLMSSLCQMLNRTCQFHIMRFEQLLDAVAKQKMDVAIGSITITPERSKIVNFSLPYLVSSSRFVEKQIVSNQIFSLDKLNNKKIGIGTATVFGDQLITMGVKNPIIA
jgi:polar amino acid transport system substrate-binding protein